LRTISELNHHIRNALQVISYASAAQTRADSMKLIGSSVERIEWALREVLPGSEPAPTTTLLEEEREVGSRADS
jgi:uncharacterized protein YmfQ (DUF2313 family)